MLVEVDVRLREEIADPQGTVVAGALRDLGYQEVRGVRIGKTIRVEVAGEDPVEVETRVREMCNRLLANPVMEDFEIRILS